MTDEIRVKVALADWESLMERGKLTQKCPRCGTEEAAGGYCSKCDLPLGPQHYFLRRRATEEDE
jgi:methionyl-tRNA synthetase